MKSTKELLGARIGELRKRKNFTQEEIAKKIEIGPKHLSKIETGGSYPSLETLERIAEVLEVDLKDFFDFEHLHEETPNDKTICKMLKGVDMEKIKLLIKIIRAVVK